MLCGIIKVKSEVVLCNKLEIKTKTFLHNTYFISNCNFCFQLAFAQVRLSDCVPHVCGLLSVEHCGVPKGKHDGMCVTILVTVTSKTGNLDLLTSDYTWCFLHDPDLLLGVRNRLAKQKIVTFINLHK